MSFIQSVIGNIINKPRRDITSNNSTGVFETGIQSNTDLVQQAEAKRRLADAMKQQQQQIKTPPTTTQNFKELPKAGSPQRPMTPYTNVEGIQYHPPQRVPETPTRPTPSIQLMPRPPTREGDWGGRNIPQPRPPQGPFPRNPSMPQPPIRRGPSLPGMTERWINAPTGPQPPSQKLPLPPYKGWIPGQSEFPYQRPADPRHRGNQVIALEPFKTTNDFKQEQEQYKNSLIKTKLTGQALAQTGKI